MVRRISSISCWNLNHFLGGFLALGVFLAGAAKTFFCPRRLGPMARRDSFEKMPSITSELSELCPQRGLLFENHSCSDILIWYFIKNNSDSNHFPIRSVSGPRRDPMRLPCVCWLWVWLSIAASFPLEGRDEDHGGERAWEMPKIWDDGQWPNDGVRTYLWERRSWCWPIEPEISALASLLAVKQTYFWTQWFTEPIILWSFAVPGAGAKKTAQGTGPTEEPGQIWPKTADVACHHQQFWNIEHLRLNVVQNQLNLFLNPKTFGKESWSYYSMWMSGVFGATFRACRSHLSQRSKQDMVCHSTDSFMRFAGRTWLPKYTFGMPTNLPANPNHCPVESGLSRS